MKDRVKKIWAGLVLALLIIIAGACVEICVMLHEGIEIEYTNE